jgi:hypothetical protein
MKGKRERFREQVRSYHVPTGKRKIRDDSFLSMPL